MSITLSDAAANAMADACVDLLDSGSSNSHPQLRLVISDQSSIVATLNFTDATAFGDAFVGVATAGTIESDSSAAGGLAEVYQCVDKTGAVIFSGTVSATNGGGDLTLSTNSIASGDLVAITSMSFTQPQTES